MKQNPWTGFDPEGLAVEPTMPDVRAIGTVAVRVADGVADAFVAFFGGPGKGAYQPRPISRALGMEPIGMPVTAEQYRQLQDGSEALLAGIAAPGAFGDKSRPPKPELRPQKGSGMQGDVDAYGNLKHTAAKTGLEVHEIPSRAAQEKAFIQNFLSATGRLPTTSEISAARNNNPSVLVTPETHKQTDTYKGNNSATKVEKDSRNLDEASRRGQEDLINAGRKTGADLAQSARELRGRQENEVQDRSR